MTTFEKAKMYDSSSEGEESSRAGGGLRDMGGIVMRQETQELEAILQAVGIPYEEANEYKLCALPEGKRVAKNKGDDGWTPTGQELKALPAEWAVKEESSCCDRTFLGSARPFTLHFINKKHEKEQWKGVQPKGVSCGGCCCCPQRLLMYDTRDGGEKQIGRVIENFSPYLPKCFMWLCCCTVYHDIQRGDESGGYETLYTLRANMCCCGRVNNCCGAYPCRPNSIFDVVDKEGNVAANLQKTYGKDGCNSVLRCLGDYSNYLLDFPPNASEEERVLLVASMYNLDYNEYEYNAGDDWD